MKYKKQPDLLDKYRPGAFVPMGDFFIIAESPRGSIFLYIGDEL
jgi:NADH:ubiquinone oxidoreductase subunit D